MWISFCLCFTTPVCAQESKEEVVANLAAGRVTVLVAKDAILFSTQGNAMEAAARPPVVVQLSERRVAVLLGAYEWTQPLTRRAPVRLDRELPKLMGQVSGPRRLDAEHTSDIESLGVALLDPLRNAAGWLHEKLELGEEEPVVELLLIGYVEEYGPEVWLLKYRIAQDILRTDFWRTRVLRPSYEQLYPPEKGQPRTIVEARYPAEDTAPGLLELFNQNDPRLARIRSGGPLAAKAAERLAKGESHKTELDAATEFFRAALVATVPQEVPLTLGVIRQMRGLEWVLAPAELPEPLEESKPRPAGAPTLKRP